LIALRRDDGARNSGLVSYGPDGVDQFGRAAGMSIASSRAKRLPIGQCKRRPNMSWSPNLKTAKTLGLTIPQSLITTADDGITAGIYDRRNGVGPLFCVATTLRTECPLWVISGHVELSEKASARLK
jgi:hypothetical protein